MSTAKAKDGKDKKKGAAEAVPAKKQKLVHVRLDGKTKELVIADLSITAKSTDDEILAVLAKHLRVDIERFSLFNVERMKDGHVYLRPDSFFSDK